MATPTEELIRRQGELNRISQTTPYGSLVYSGPDRSQADFTFSKPYQDAFDKLVQATQAAISRGQLGIEGLEYGPLDQQVAAAQKAAYETGEGLLEPTFARREASLLNELANRGIVEGSEAYNEALRARIQDPRRKAFTDLATQSTLTGYDVLKRLEDQRTARVAQAKGLLGLAESMAPGKIMPELKDFFAPAAVDVTGPEKIQAIRDQAVANQRAQQDAAVAAEKAANLSAATQIGSAGLIGGGAKALIDAVKNSLPATDAIPTGVPTGQTGGGYESLPPGVPADPTRSYRGSLRPASAQGTPDGSQVITDDGMRSTAPPISPAEAAEFYAAPTIPQDSMTGATGDFSEYFTGKGGGLSELGSDISANLGDIAPAVGTGLAAAAIQAGLQGEVGKGTAEAFAKGAGGQALISHALADAGVKSGLLSAPGLAAAGPLIAALSVPTVAQMISRPEQRAVQGFGTTPEEATYLGAHQAIVNQHGRTPSISRLADRVFAKDPELEARYESIKAGNLGGQQNLLTTGFDLFDAIIAEAGVERTGNHHEDMQVAAWETADSTERLQMFGDPNDEGGNTEWDAFQAILLKRRINAMTPEEHAAYYAEQARLLDEQNDPGE